MEKSKDETLKPPKVLKLDLFPNPLFITNDLLDDRLRLMLIDDCYRWKAESIGINKMIIKNKSLIIIMPERKDKNYYESSSFKKILDAINTNPQLYIIKEKNDRLYIYINKKISSVIEVDEILSTFE